MKRNQLLLVLSTVLCIVFFAATFTTPAFAQEPQITAVAEIQLKSGVEAEFNRFMKAEFIPTLKKGGQQQMTAWKTAVFGTSGSVVFSWPLKNFAEVDTQHPIVKALGPYGAQAMFTKLDSFAKSIQVFAMGGLPDLEIASPEGYVAKLGLQIKATIHPGRNEEYLKNVKIARDIVKKTNAKGFYAGKVGIGGNVNQYWFLVLFDTFADMDAFGVAFTKAASEAKMPSMAGIVDRMEMSMYSRDADLSIVPAAQ